MIVAVEVGPWIRRVRVLRAEYRSPVTVAVCSFSPLPDDHLVVSGLWFHSHCGPSVDVVNASVPIIDATVLEVVMFGLGYVAPQAPLTVVIVGQLSELQVIGARTGIRPPG